MSIHSPKNKFRGTISFTFKEGRKTSNTTHSYSSMNVEELKSWFDEYRRRHGFVKGYVTIRENKSTYPEFNWETIETYIIEK